MKKEGWLKNNISSLVTIWWCLTSTIILLIILCSPVSANDKEHIMILQMINSIMTFILGYYFGSSKTQNEKAKAEFENKTTTESSVTKTDSTTEHKAV